MKWSKKLSFCYIIYRKKPRTPSSRQTSYFPNSKQIGCTEHHGNLYTLSFHDLNLRTKGCLLCAVPTQTGTADKGQTQLKASKHPSSSQGYFELKQAKHSEHSVSSKRATSKTSVQCITQLESNKAFVHCKWIYVILHKPTSYPESPSVQQLPSDKHLCYIYTITECMTQILNSNFRRLDPFLLVRCNIF